MIRFAEVAIGTGGSGCCTACGGTDAASAAPFASVVALIDAAASTRDGVGAPNVFFSGFEPFAHPELPRLIDAARTRGFERIKLRTDGRFLDKGGNASGAFSAGVTHLELVLLAGDADDHDRLSGSPGGFESAAAGAALYRAVARDAGVLTGYLPLCRHTVRHAPATVAKLAEVGAAAVQLDAIGLKESAENRAFVLAALETATVNRVAAFVTGGFADVPPVYLVAPYHVSEVQR